MEKKQKIKGYTEFSKNQNRRPEIKELAALKQHLFLSAYSIDFFNVNSMRPNKWVHTPQSWYSVVDFFMVGVITIRN